jgi:hypothetical protein
MDTSAETYNPWSIVNLVFRQLADEGLHPVLGESGDPGKPAAELLRALGVTPAVEGSKHVSSRVNDELARLREAYEAGHQAGHETGREADSQSIKPTNLLRRSYRGYSRREGRNSEEPRDRRAYHRLRVRAQAAPRRCVIHSTGP